MRQREVPKGLLYISVLYLPCQFKISLGRVPNLFSYLALQCLKPALKVLNTGHRKRMIKFVLSKITINALYYTVFV